MNGVSRVKIYWLIWLIIITTCIVLRLVRPAALNPYRPILAIFFFLGGGISLAVMGKVEGMILMKYLRANHYDKWAELTYLPGWGPGCNNGFRSLPWLYSTDDSGDEILASLKADARRVNLFGWTAF